MMPKKTTRMRALKALRRGVEFLYEIQEDDGGFSGVMSTSPTLIHNRQVDDSIFPALIVANCLENVQGPEVEMIRLRIMNLIVEECQPCGNWRYWRNRSGRNISCDTDDSALALKLLGDLWPPERRGRSVAKILSLRAGDGGIKTWVTGEQSDNDIDLVVNLNVIASLWPEFFVDDIIDWVVRALDSSSSSSYYYPDPSSVSYALAQCVRRGVPLMPQLIRHTSSLSKARTGDAVALAQRLIARCVQCGEFDYSCVEELFATQQANGSWPEVAWYVGPRPPQAPSFWFGSAAMSTAFSIQACSCIASIGRADSFGDEEHDL